MIILTLCVVIYMLCVCLNARVASSPTKKKWPVEHYEVSNIQVQ